MIFEVTPTGALLANCYIIGDKESVIVIDPGDEGEKIYDFIFKNNLNVSEIVLTHGHFDHIGAVSYLKEKTNAIISIHKDDKDMLLDKNENLAVTFTNMDVRAREADRLLLDNDIVKAGSYEFRVIHTPGHSMGGICLYGEGILISGDTLFKGTIGRYDFGDYNLLIKSVKKLALLPKETVVYPGHGDKTTIEYEIKNNPYLRNDIYEY